jgi:hypothetical protein
VLIIGWQCSRQQLLAAAAKVSAVDAGPVVLSGLQETFIMDLVDQCYRWGWFSHAVLSLWCGFGGHRIVFYTGFSRVHQWLAALRQQRILLLFKFLRLVGCLGT